MAEDRDRWQYRVVNLGMFNTAERITSALGRMGADGWELVTVYDKASNWLANMEKGFVLFKRRVPAGQEPVGMWATWSRADDGAVSSEAPGRVIMYAAPHADAVRDVEAALPRKARLLDIDRTIGQIDAETGGQAPDGSGWFGINMGIRIEAVDDVSSRVRVSATSLQRGVEAESAKAVDALIDRLPRSWESEQA